MRASLKTLVPAVACLLLAAPARGQESPTPKIFASKTVTHIGVVVRDVEAVAKAYADVFGVPISQAIDAKGVSFPASHRGDPTAHPKIVNVQFDNIRVELAQPVGGSSPWRDFLDTYGEGIHHIGISVTDLEAHVRLLESLGGRRTLGAVGGSYAFVDLMPQLGITIEVNKVDTPLPPQGQPAGHGLKVLARIGMLADEADPFREAWQTLFDVPVAPAITAKGVPMPKEFQAVYDPNASNREQYVPLDNTWVNVIEANGGRSPWRDLVDKRTGFHYMNFNVEDVEATVRMLESKGGKRTLGDVGTPFAYVDMPRLGVTILLLRPRPPAAAAAAPKPLTLEDRLDIQQLYAQYAHGIDTHADDGRMYADTYTEDGVLAITGGRTFDGRAALIALAKAPGDPTLVHAVVNVSIQPSPEGAQAVANMMQLTLGAPGAPPVVRGFGRYEDIVVRTPAGWRFKHKQWTVLTAPAK